eukprot:scaffold152008_cov39-Attheya_sp.AAC.1
MNQLSSTMMRRAIASPTIRQVRRTVSLLTQRLGSRSFIVLESDHLSDVWRSDADGDNIMYE